jgi:hypothetical protein
MFRSAKSAAVLGLSLLIGYASLASGDAAGDRRLAGELRAALPSLVVSEDYRTLSESTLRLASVYSRLGETPEACRALSQSLESYRMAVAKESGISDVVSSSINDDSDGMAEVRSRFGCAKV